MLSFWPSLIIHLPDINYLLKLNICMENVREKKVEAYHIDSSSTFHWNLP